MRIIPVACLQDNYAYLVAKDGSKDAFVVDPSEAEPVIAALASEGLDLVAIVNTHHHHDHVGGNAALRKKFGDVPVYAHESDEGRVPEQTVKVRENERVDVAGLSLLPLHVPGHTTGAVAYVVEDAVFTGDTLFIGGCGRLFEGTPAMMNTSLNEKLAKLPKATRIFCGHEYTASNLRFAAHVEPNNEAVKKKLERVKAQRDRNEPTMGTTIGEELETNPFMRVGEKSLKERYKLDAAADVLGATRKEKDGFKE